MVEIVVKDEAGASEIGRRDQPMEQPQEKQSLLSERQSSNLAFFGQSSSFASDKDNPAVVMALSSSASAASAASAGRCVQALSVYWRSILLVVFPIALSPILTLGDEQANTVKAFRCLYVMCLMACYWVPELLPLSATALIPIVLLPFLGIMTTDAVCREYMKESNCMLLAGMMVAVAMEHSNLHSRISLKVLLLLEASLRSLMAGFMLTTAFLSMWISNTATTNMMVPILEAVLTEVEADLSLQQQHERGDGGDDGERICMDAVTERGKGEVGAGDGALERRRSAGSSVGESAARSGPSQVRIMLFLCVAYAANIGGTATLTGTGTALTFKGIIAEISNDKAPVNFATWMGYNFGVMLVNLCWFVGFKSTWRALKETVSVKCSSKTDNGMKKTPAKGAAAIKSILQDKYDELGGITTHEVLVLVLFVLLVVLWIFRDPKFIDGWGTNIFALEEEHNKLNSTDFADCGDGVANVTLYERVMEPKPAVDDASAGMLIVLLLFALPARPTFWPFARGGGAPTRSPALLDWDYMQRKLQWALLLLMGGGFALAKASKLSGLSELISGKLEGLKDLDSLLIVVVVSVMVAAATEITSNAATASIILPVLGKVASKLHLNPLYLMVPVTNACSFAFMLPMATPPNAVVHKHSGMAISDMAKCGFFLNVICIVTGIINLELLGDLVFQMDEFPEWANKTNQTS